MNRSFKYTKNFEDHPDMQLLNSEWKLQDGIPGPRARSLKELSQKKDRSSNIMVVCPSPHEIQSIKEYEKKNRNQRESELSNLQKLLDSNYEAPRDAIRRKCRAK